MKLTNVFIVDRRFDLIKLCFYSLKMWFFALTGVGRAGLVTNSVQMVLVNWLTMSEEPQWSARAESQTLQLLIRFSPHGKKAHVFCKHMFYANKGLPCRA